MLDDSQAGKQHVYPIFRLERFYISHKSLVPNPSSPARISQHNSFGWPTPKRGATRNAEHHSTTSLPIIHGFRLFFNQGKPSPYTVNLKHAIPMTDSTGVGDLALLDCLFCVSEILTHTYSTIFPEFSPLFSSYTRICLLSGYRTISGQVQPTQSHLHVPW